MEEIKKDNEVGFNEDFTLFRLGDYTFENMLGGSCMGKKISQERGGGVMRCETETNTEAEKVSVLINENIEKIEKEFGLTVKKAENVGPYVYLNVYDKEKYARYQERVLANGNERFERLKKIIEG